LHKASAGFDAEGFLSSAEGEQIESCASGVWQQRHTAGGCGARQIGIEARESDFAESATETIGGGKMNCIKTLQRVLLGKVSRSPYYCFVDRNNFENAPIGLEFLSEALEVVGRDFAGTAFWKMRISSRHRLACRSRFRQRRAQVSPEVQQRRV
jgi:hypothetical protein